MELSDLEDLLLLAYFDETLVSDDIYFCVGYFTYAWGSVTLGAGRLAAERLQSQELLISGSGATGAQEQLRAEERVWERFPSMFEDAPDYRSGRDMAGEAYRITSDGSFQAEAIRRRRSDDIEKLLSEAAGAFSEIGGSRIEQSKLDEIFQLLSDLKSKVIEIEKSQEMQSEMICRIESAEKAVAAPTPPRRAIQMLLSPLIKTSVGEFVKRIISLLFD